MYQTNAPNQQRYLYWNPIFQTFSYMPDDIYANIDTDKFGNPLTFEEVCPTGCVQLQQGKEKNIVGMSNLCFN